ncbi:MAG: hypothetical protein Q8S02_11740 [Hydrogenophaga sp.]|nr:hypothetical protein [Hydrogenophaga sp.]
MTEPRSKAFEAAEISDTFTLLEQCAAYLRCMPPVQVTLEMIRKIEDHLAQPEVFTAQRLGSLNSKVMELRHQVRTARNFAPSGTPLFEVEVQGNRVRVRVHEAYLQESGSPAMHQANALKLMDMLASGVELEVVVDEKATAQRMWSEP